ncbi:MAG: tyrosine-type recombinase/integrase [Zavarzinella sp.]
MLAKIVERVELEKAGIGDHRTTKFQKMPLREHLQAWRESLHANNCEQEYIKLKTNRVTAIIEGCQFHFCKDMNAEFLEKFLHHLRTNQGMSTQTTKHYLQAAKQFVLWMIENDRIDRNPFKTVKPGNVAIDAERRGEYQNDEVTRLLVAAEAGKPFRGLCGSDRAMLYRLALGTGFRASELAILKPESFDLSACPPVVHLQARSSKNRQPATQPISIDLANDLRPFLAAKPKGELIWPGTWNEKAAKMIRRDMEAAGIPVETTSPEGDEVRDFHALRSTYISNLIRSGADTKQVMTLARHSDPKLTMKRYARTKLSDLAEKVNGLPTGKKFAPQFAPDSDNLMQTMTTDEDLNSSGNVDSIISEGTGNPVKYDTCGDMVTAEDENLEARPAGVEPATYGSEDRFCKFANYLFCKYFRRIESPRCTQCCTSFFAIRCQ